MIHCFCSILDVIIVGTTAKNNGKGDVIISEIVKIQPISDVFSHPSILNRTNCIEISDSEEDSVDLNNTVIEID